MTAVVTALVMATSACIGSLQWSRPQVANSELGATMAKVAPFDQGAFSPGEELAPARWLDGVDARVTVIPVWGSAVSLRTDAGQFDDAAYTELAMPSPVLSGIMDIVAGRWPLSAGECVTTTGAAGWAESPIGEWGLTVVGQVRNVFHPQSIEWLCAPGTWATWSLTTTEHQTISTMASTRYYFDGNPDLVNLEVARLAQEGVFGAAYTFDAETRDHLLKPPNRSVNKVMGDRLPLLLLPFSVGLVMAGRLAGWSGRVSRTLVRAGVPSVPMRRTMAGTALVGTALVSVVGVVTGWLFALTARPLLSSLNGGKPLSDGLFPAADLSGVLLASVVGTGIGLWVGDAVSSARLGQQDRTPTPLSRRARVALVPFGLLFVGVAAWLMVASDSRLWWMSGGALMMVVAFATWTPLLVGMLGGALSRRPVSSGTLTGRILVEGSRRWSVVTVIVTLVVGLVCSLFVIASSSIAAQVAYMSPRVPAGSVRVEVEKDAGEKIPAQMLERFTSDLGLSTPPITMTELGLGPLSGGLLQSVETLEDARSLLGDVPSQAMDVLARGGVLVVGATPNSSDTIPVQAVGGGSDAGGMDTTDVPVLSVKPDAAHRWATGAGFVLRPALPDTMRQAATIRVWNVYQGLTPHQETVARNWAADTGMTAFMVDYSRPPTGFYMPLWLAISLIGFGLLFAPVLALALRGNVRTLSSLASTLTSVGIARTWIKPVFGLINITVISVAVVAAVAPALISITILATKYPRIFDLQGTPWWMLVVFVAALLGATHIATRSAFTSLKRKEHIITV